MKSTFHGLETAKRSLNVQTSAMQTMGHNIANVETEGYSRQRVNISATRPMYFPGMSRAQVPGQIGTGVQYDGIERVRDQFLDLQFRRENSTYAEWSVRRANLMQIEKIVNEPLDSGLRTTMDKFWNSWEVLNRDPSLLSARIDVIGSATNLVDTLQHMGEAFRTLHADLDHNITAKLAETENLLQNIAGSNEQIRKIEALGDHANDLRDQRDLLVDQLSTIVDVVVTEEPNGDYTLQSAGVQVVTGDEYTPLDLAAIDTVTSGELAGYREAKAEVELVRDQFNAMVHTLVTGKVSVTLPNGYMTNTDLVAETEVTLANGDVIAAGDTIPQGSVIESAVTVEVDGFNGLHALGYGLGSPATNGIPFFVNDGGDFTIDNIRVNPDILQDTSLIAASGKYEDIDGTLTPIRGNSDIAHALSRLRDATFTYPQTSTNMTEGTTDDYFRALVGQIGISSANAERNALNQQDRVESINMFRQSVSGVSINEEIVDMIRFQHAYNAAARTMTTVDEMLDRIINQMGIVGR